MRGLVNYSSSDGDDGATPSTSAPGNHAATTARVRSFPHVDGQFAVHVRVPADPPEAVASAMRAAVAKLAPSVPGLTPVDGLASTPPALHLSLSRVATLPGREVPALVDGLVATLTDEGTAGALPAGGFDLDLTSPAVLENEEGTQCFLALAAAAAGAPAEPYRAAVRAADAAGALVGLPPFYAHPLPHASFAWAPAASAAALREALRAGGCAGLAPWRLGVRAVAVKAGKRTVVVWRARGCKGGRGS